MAEVILVNPDKVQRAQEILDLVTGKKIPQEDRERERKVRFSQILAEADIAPKSKGALQFIYETLGGLVRTEAEEAKAKARKATAGKKKVARE